MTVSFHCRFSEHRAMHITLSASYVLFVHEALIMYHSQLMSQIRSIVLNVTNCELTKFLPFWLIG